MRVLTLLLLALALPLPEAESWWSDERDPQAAPPYPMPVDWNYTTVSAPAAIVEGKINVHLVPHTHDDTGWQVTVDQYFFTDVYYVLDTIVPRLAEDPARRFIYVEIGFFARWWDVQTRAKQDLTRTLVSEGRLEFINGGWCMHDEASPFYVEMIDQTTRGHQFLRKNFGDTAIPKGTWQIDPFGHSNTQAWLLGAEAGFDSMYWGRTDYQDVELRTSTAGKKDNHWLEWVWRGSPSLGAKADIFAGELTTGQYAAPIDFNDGSKQVQDDPRRHDYNVDFWVDQFITAAVKLQNNTRSIHQMWPCGSDFNYQNADHWFHNLDKFIHYVNLNASRGGPVVAMYSTPTVYTSAKQRVNLTWEVRHDDIFPLADNDHAYWSGYFTSRPALKRQVRVNSNLLNAARQLEIVTKTTTGEVDTPTIRPSPAVGTSWTDSLEGTVGVATHHDGMSGTERQDVSNDYELRIAESGTEVEVGVAASMAKLLAGGSHVSDWKHCNCNGGGGDCLNISVCAATTGADEFILAAWNPLAQEGSSWLSIPVSGTAWQISAHNASGPAFLPSQISALSNRTLSLPELYLNSYGMGASEKAAAQMELANKATHVLQFRATIPPVGLATFVFKRLSDDTAVAAAAAATAVESSSGEQSVTNGIYTLKYDSEKGVITGLTNEASGLTTSLNVSWGWYRSSEGGCTGGTNAKGEWIFDMHGCSDQASGAYMFRPNSSVVYPCGAEKPTLTVTNGPLVTEITQHFSDWCTHVVRLRKGDAYIEVEWTAGPIPLGQEWIPTPPPAPPPAGQCIGFESDAGKKLSCTAVVPSSDSGHCTCGGGQFTAAAGHPPLTCDDACAGRSCVAWEQTANCGPTVQPSLSKPCSFEPPIYASGFCQCSMGRRVGSGGQAPFNWPSHGCNVDKGGNCSEICARPPPQDNWGKELIMRYSSDLANKGTFYTDANGREMVKRKTNGRGPSYPPLQVFEPVAANYFPVNSIISLDDGKAELAVISDVSVGGSSLRDGQLELMLHRRIQVDDSRGVQEPLNETMCGCNDIHAQPGQMGEHGQEADGGCECAGLTIRGKHVLIFDTVDNAHKLRRQLVESLSFPPTIAFSSAGSKGSGIKPVSFLSQSLPANIKLLTLTDNYASHNNGTILLRLAHLYAAGEHSTLSLPATVSLRTVFASKKLLVVAATEMSLTANQEAVAMDARRAAVGSDPWNTGTVGGNRKRLDPRDATLSVVIQPMEVRTFLVKLG